MRYVFAFLFLMSSLSAKVLNEEEAIRWVLKEGGAGSELVDDIKIEGVAESLGVVYRITAGENIFYLKFSEREGARGSFFLKFLIPVDERYRSWHAEQRRIWGRKLLYKMREDARETLFPLPFSFGEKMEIRVPFGNDEVEFPKKLQGLLATLWEGLDVESFPLEGLDPYHPLDYSPQSIFEMMKGYGEFQKKAEHALAYSLKDTNDLSQVLNSAHEERSLPQWEELVVEPFLLSLGFNPESMTLERFSKGLREADSREREKIFLAASKTEAILLFSIEILSDYLELPWKKGLSLGQSLERIEKAFLKKAHRFEEHSDFNALAFRAERDKLWNEEEVSLSKAIILMKEAKKMVDWLREDLDGVADFIEKLSLFQPLYEQLSKLPVSVVLQDAHPANILRNKADGKVTFLDFDDLSLGYKIADLANVYFYKVLEKGVEGKFSSEELLPWIEAVISGYEEGTEESLPKEVISLIPVYSAAVHLNHLKQVSLILSPDFENLDRVNQAFSFSNFLEDWDKRLKAIEFLDKML